MSRRISRVVVVLAGFVSVSALGAQPSAQTASANGTAANRPAAVELPDVDVATLGPEQRGQWRMIQDRFPSTAAHVDQAHRRLDELSARLSRRHLTLDRGHAAAALRMQGFLDQAIALTATHEFELALAALVRADYQRRRLSNVIGQ